jgi:hypothetical protein
MADRRAGRKATATGTLKKEQSKSAPSTHQTGDNRLGLFRALDDRSHLWSLITEQHTVPRHNSVHL